MDQSIPTSRNGNKNMANLKVTATKCYIKLLFGYSYLISSFAHYDSVTDLSVYTNVAMLTATIQSHDAIVTFILAVFSQLCFRAENHIGLL